MHVLTNKGRRRLGIPGRPALILEPGQTVRITEHQLKAMRANRTFVRWLERDVVAIDDPEVGEVSSEATGASPVVPKRTAGTRPPPRVSSAKRSEPELPEGVSGEGVEMHHSGGGWWEVYVNGFKVTDKNVRKDEAETIAAEYE